MQKFITLSAISTSLLLSFITANACTTWASIGSVNKNSSSTLITKNRDASHHGIEKLAIIQGKPYRYLALIYTTKPKGKTFPYISAGINEKGISVVNNAASATPTKHRDRGETITMKKILSHYGSVADVLKAKNKLFTTSLVNNLIIAGPKEIAVVEIGKDGKYNIRTKRNGVVYHTNQYEGKNLLSQNKNVFPDSLIRYKTIGSLLTKKHEPFSCNKDIQMSERQLHGLNDSIFREWTVATWAARIPQNGAPFLYVRFTNPNQAYHVYRLTLNKAFWKHKTFPKTRSE